MASSREPTEPRGSAHRPASAGDHGADFEAQEAGDDTQQAGKRGRGRPAIGKIFKVRLDEEQEMFASLLGEGNLAEGLRRAIENCRLNMPGKTGKVTGDTVEEMEPLMVRTAQADQVRARGEGSFARGLDALLRVSEFLTDGAFARLAKPPKK